MNFLRNIARKMNKFFRNIRNNIHRRKLTNTDFSLFASNCNGCVLLHDLGQKFNSPFVNLFLDADDYLKFLKNPHHYLGCCEFTFIREDGIEYPLAMLGDIKVHFVHYATAEDAVQKWNERKQRINWDNLFIMMTDRDGCTYEHLEQFDNLPYNNKVVFTNKKYEEFDSAFYLRGFETQPCVGSCIAFRNCFGKRYLDDFDYISWFNNSK